jgi:outer membrane murein-binding lipoprotein Lpp
MTLADVAQIIVVQLVGTAFAAVGVYAAIRADLAQLNARVQHAEDSAERANERIDSLIDRLRP